MYRDYYQDYCEVKPEFNKEFVSLWAGWLGAENYHKLDEVSETEWKKFNEFIKLLSSKFKLQLVDWELESIKTINNIESTISNYEQSMDKEASEFTKYIIPELDCIISEEWDYTYIIWHKNNGAVKALEPYINKAGLYHFKD